MDPSREAHYMSTKFLDCLGKRQQKAAEWNSNLRNAEVKWNKRLSWNFRALRSLPEDFERYGKTDTYSHRRQTLEEEWRRRSGRQRGSVTWALNDVMVGFWAGGLFKVAGDTSQMMTPLVTKALILFSQEGWLCLTMTAKR